MTLHKPGPREGVSPVLTDMVVNSASGRRIAGGSGLLGKVHFHGKYSSDEGRIWPGFTLLHTYSEAREESWDEAGTGYPHRERLPPVQVQGSWKYPFSFHRGKKSLCLRVLQRNKQNYPYGDMRFSIIVSI